MLHNLIKYCFNPRSRTGSDLVPPDVLLVPVVSIHAPERGATSDSRFHLLPEVFQSTLPNGERPQPISGRRPTKMFQSTLPNGERPQPISGRRPTKMFQSTLPNGERHGGSYRDKRGHGFNPRSRTGSDMCLHTFLHHHNWLFQSTLPNGERPTACT